MNIIIFNGVVAKDLIDTKVGELVTIQANNNDPARTVFHFKDTKSLREYLKERHNITINK